MWSFPCWRSRRGRRKISPIHLSGDKIHAFLRANTAFTPCFGIAWLIIRRIRPDSNGGLEEGLLSFEITAAGEDSPEQTHWSFCEEKIMRKVWLVVFIVVWSMSQGLPCFGQAQNDLQKHPECKYCGMKRKNFANSRMVLDHQRGKSVGVCSVFCAAKDNIENVDDPPVSVKVGDYTSQRLIDAVTATWVIGGSKPGVMTDRAKWAFARKEDALAFIKRYGGELIDYDTAMKASYEDMYEDMRVLKQMKLEHSRIKAHRSLSKLNRN
jgi:copper chaperone NosL